MNIEEERKAFEAWRDKQPTGAYADLASWLAAKAHAEEMAKPAILLWHDPHSKLWEASRDGVFVDAFDTESEGLGWAKANGYRVVSE